MGSETTSQKKKPSSPCLSFLAKEAKKVKEKIKSLATKVESEEFDDEMVMVSVAEPVTPFRSPDADSCAERNRRPFGLCQVERPPGEL